MPCGTKIDGKGGEKISMPMPKAPKFMPLKNATTTMPAQKMKGDNEDEISLAWRKRRLVAELAKKEAELAKNPITLIKETAKGLPAAAKKIGSFVSGKWKNIGKERRQKSALYWKNLQKETDALREEVKEQNIWNKRNMFRKK